MALFLQNLGGTVIILIENPGMKVLDKILRSEVRVNILEEYILKYKRGRIEGVKYEAEVVDRCLLGSRTLSSYSLHPRSTQDGGK